jgi:hypothetical protein
MDNRRPGHKIITACLAAAIAVSAASCSNGAGVGASVVSKPSPGQCVYISLDPEGDGSGVFEFTPIVEDRAAAAIFTRKPQVEDYRVLNEETAVWVWESRMDTDGRATEGTLQFGDGTGTQAGSAGEPDDMRSCARRKDCDQKAVALQSGKLHYFGIWAWDRDRDLAVFPSKFTQFCVTHEKDIQGNPLCPAVCD